MDETMQDLIAFCTFMNTACLISLVVLKALKDKYDTDAEEKMLNLLKTIREDTWDTMSYTCQAKSTLENIERDVEEIKKVTTESKEKQQKNFNTLRNIQREIKKTNAQLEKKNEV